jgi:hypothetical protein
MKLDFSPPAKKGNLDIPFPISWIGRELTIVSTVVIMRDFRILSGYSRTKTLVVALPGRDYV